LREISEKSNRI